MSLVKFADGSWRDVMGFVAMVMLRWHGVDASGLKVFQFVVDPFSPAVDIRSPTDAVLIADTYRPLMIREGYARDVTDEEALHPDTKVDDGGQVDDDAGNPPDPIKNPENPADTGKDANASPDGAGNGTSTDDGAEKQAGEAKEPPPPAGDGAKAAAPAAKTGAKK